MPGLWEVPPVKAPPVFIALRTTGDGYGHNSVTYLSWHFDEKEAQTAADAACADTQERPTGWASVEEVQAPDPQEKKEW